MLLPEKIDFTILLYQYIIPYSLKILIALVILLLGRHILRLLVSLIRRGLDKTRLDQIVIHFILSIIQAVLLLMVIVAALDQLGVNTSSLIALLGAAGLAVGLALQNSLQNFAAGVLLIVLRPFKAGDYIEAAGVSGTVDAINIFSSTLRTADNCEIIVPNGSIYSGTITNYSARETRRIDLQIGVAYEDDLKKVRRILQQIITAEQRILPEPGCLIAVSELADSSVKLVVRPWVNSADYWAVKFDLLEKIKLAFDQNKIHIPYPQMDIHLNKSSSG